MGVLLTGSLEVLHRGCDPDTALELVVVVTGVGGRLVLAFEERLREK